MVDYSKLIKKLRNGGMPVMKQAADAIEELSRELHEYRKYDVFLALHGCFDSNIIENKSEPERK